MPRVRFSTIAILLCLAARAAAKDKDLRYLTPDAIHVEFLLPPPPTVGSEEQKAEIDVMLAIQATRTPAQVKRFEAEITFDMSAFDGVMGSWFTPHNLPKLDKLLKEAAAESKFFSVAAKDTYRRKRPFCADSRIKPLDDREVDYGYPTGHGTRGFLFACILARIESKKKDALMERGRQIGWDRVIGGVHYPSDIAAGRVLGLTIAHLLLSNREFEGQLREAKIEYDQFKKDHVLAPLAPAAARRCVVPNPA